MAYEKEVIAQKVVAMLAQKLEKKPEEIHSDSTLDSLGADSLDRVEMVMTCEEKFGIEINDADADSLQTVQQIVDYIYQHQK